MSSDKIIELARKVGFVIEVSTDPNSSPSWHGQAHNDTFEAFVAALTEPLENDIDQLNTTLLKADKRIVELEAAANLTVSPMPNDFKQILKEACERSYMDGAERATQLTVESLNAKGLLLSGPLLK